MTQDHLAIILAVFGVISLLWSFYTVYGKKLTSYTSHADAVMKGCVGITVGIALLCIGGIVALI